MLLFEGIAQIRQSITIEGSLLLASMLRVLVLQTKIRQNLSRI